ncbi:hypothetical protein A3742_08730 [Oleiphilus sp. HI0071]|uniref:AraC family transcriptional regulator n=1 Tax=unclassified Oleiphilus TaxID=2631174 RepID=UPI0007C2F944|nr:MULTISPECIES: AraC family transcriptional regulator [unclassified Oleiphilus]KZY68946.1 hypothetical protein A3737_12735 [Oleiphilus sp. HI0065]KZY82607.1 hypothetical protein A3742_08730 [Oleiphilus sp. HI0071]KZY92602.1 hypothetical protein A3744_02585 [Oleiphilus sp. HI0073]KZZ44573.1 hypothetical protein A3758_14900 [Oleiphilus sp. HI0118]KZZ61804.1 hypothetical protein A3760_04355 [Oleiphilus sp. HI0122]KZZ78376.1 hypothetical protein A3765_08140 [Oleiphilus sp. HI0130]
MPAIDSSATVSAAAAVDLVELCLRYGLISDAELSALGADSVLQATPDQRIAESSYIALWDRLAQSKHAAGLGLRIGQTINPNAKGLLASWVSQTTTLGEALSVFIEHIALMNPSECWEVERHQDRCVLCFSLRHEEAYPNMAVERSMSAMLAWAKLLSGHEFPITKASFTFTKPSYIDAFYSVFGTDICFSSGQNSLEFDASLLDLPVMSGNHFLKSIIQEKAKSAWKAIGSGVSLTEQIQRQITSELDAGRGVSVMSLSDQLNISRQTLYRQLKQEGTSFQTMYDEARKQRALDQLKRNNISIQALSLELGFKDSSSFYKAFKRWYGISPKDYLESIL